MFDDLRALDSQLVVVRNPFNRAERDVRPVPADGMSTVAALVGEYIPAGVEVDVSINGHRLAEHAWATYNLARGDQMVVVPRVEGGGNGILGSVLMIALLVAAPYLAPMVAGAVGVTSAMGIMAIQIGIGLVGSMVIGALTAPTAAALPGASSYDNSQAYSWVPMTTQTPGGPVARAYGLIKLYGNIIAGYIENTGDTGAEQTAHMLVELGMGPFDSLSDFKINDQPVSLYAGVTVTERLGLLNQAIIPSFNDTRANSTFSPAQVVAGTPIVRGTVGNEFSALEIVLTCPGGLYYSNDQGGMDAHAVNIRVEMSKNGGAWTDISNSALTLATSPAGYWTFGYWTQTWQGSTLVNTVWTEVTRGSTVRTDHTLGDGNASGVWQWIADAIPIATAVNNYIILSGSATKAIRKTLRVNGLAPGDSCSIRVTNLSTDYTGNSRYGDAVYLSAVNEVILDDFTYPRSVLVGIDALATNQLSGAMKFSCIARAAKVRVYRGGAWYFEWSQSPAWVTFDILTQPVMSDDGATVLRYDGFDPSRLDLQSFIDWAAFCAALVPDGKGLGGTEPRCLFDGVFDVASDMWSAALTVAATARATLVMRGTTYAVVYDDTRATPVQLFTVANSSGFTETFLPVEGRASAIEVSFTNVETDYARDVVSVINEAVAAASGVTTPASKAMIGVTRTSQAWREVNTMLKRNELLQRTGELSVDIDSLVATVGDRVDIQVDVPEWGEGGRAVAGTTSAVTLDHAITLDAGKTYQITVRLSTGTDEVDTRTISTAPGTVSAVSVTSPFSSAVSKYDVWAIGEVGKVTKPFIVTDLARDSDQRAKLTLIEYNGSLYGMDGGLPAQPTPNISASTGFSKIIDVTISEHQEVSGDGTSITVVTLHWGFEDRSKVRATRIIAQPNGPSSFGQVDKMQRVTGDSAQFSGMEDGAGYLFTLLSENYLGQTQPMSAGATIQYGVVGRTGQTFGPGVAGVPNAPTALTATGGLFAVALAWTLDVGARRDIRHTEIWAATTNNRASAARISCEPWPSLSYTHIGLQPGQTWYYWIRLADTTGNLSGWYPAGATAGVAASPSTDPSALLAQLVAAVGMPQLGADLAAPIASVIDPANLAHTTADAYAQAQTAAIAALQAVVNTNDLQTMATREKWISDATTIIDPSTGKVTLIATASITTDVEAHLNAVDVTLSAQAGSISSNTSAITSYGTRITTAETNITSLQGAITLTASTSYVDGSISTALGAIDPANVATASQLGAEAMLNALIDVDAGRKIEQGALVRLAFAQTTLTTHADALGAQATALTVLAAAIDANAASIVNEQTARSDAVSAEAAARLALAATVAGAVSSATLTANYSTTATMTSAIASAISTLQSTVAGNLATALVSYTTTTGMNSAISSAITTLSASVGSSIAAVSVTASAAASAAAGVAARWGVQVQTMADGHRALAGLTLLAGTDGESVVGILADKLIVYKPDGTGTPKQILTLGTVNGVTALGLLGDLIVDGTIVTRTIAAENITVPRSAYTSGGVNITAPTTLQTVSITTTGGPIFVTAGFQVVNIGSADVLAYQIKRDGTQVTGTGQTSASGATNACSISFTDSPGAGTFTYTLTCNAVGGVGGFNCSVRSLFVLEMKR